MVLGVRTANQLGDSLRPEGAQAVLVISILVTIRDTRYNRYARIGPLRLYDGSVRPARPI